MVFCLPLDDQRKSCQVEKNRNILSYEKLVPSCSIIDYILRLHYLNQINAIPCGVRGSNRV